MKLSIAFLTLSLLIYTPSLLAQKPNKALAKFDKTLETIEASYEQGSYNKALKALDKFKVATEKKLGANNQYTPTYYLYQAKLKLAAGIVIGLESILDNAIQSSATINKDNKLNHGLVLLQVGEIYNQNGSYRLAKENLFTANNSLESGQFFKDGVKARWELARAESQTGQGFFREAIELIKQNEPYYIKRAVKQESFVDDKGNLTSRKLTPKELIQRNNEYAKLLTQLAETFGHQGNLKSADSVFAYAANWIDKNLGRTSLAYVKNQVYNAEVLVENGNENLPRDLSYIRLLGFLKASHQPSHVLGIRLYEDYLSQLIEVGGAPYFNLKAEYEKMITGNYGKESIYKVRLKAVEFDSKLDRDRTRNLENDANVLISQTTSLPKDNITRAEVIDFLTTLAIIKKNYVNAESYIKSVITIKTNLYGEDAPEVHLSKLRLANFYVNFTNKITDAAKIYEESYPIVANEIGAWHKDHLDILNQMATLFELTDRFKEATATLDNALDVARSKYSDTDFQYGIELTNIAKLQIKLGQYEKAEENLDQALKILKEYRTDYDRKIFLINAIETQAVLFGIKGMFDEAEDALDRSARIIIKSDKLAGIDELTTAKELSSLYIQLGEYSDTEDLLKKLIKEYEKLYGTTTLRLIEPLVNMGRIQLLKGDYTEAEKIAIRANQLAVSVYGEISTKTSPTQKLLSEIDFTIGDYDRAQSNILKALASQEKQFGRNHIEVAKSIAQLALIKFNKGDNQDVEKLMLEARDIIGKKLGTNNPQYAEVLKNVAVIYIANKNYTQAFSSLTQAEAIWKSKTGAKNNINTAAIYTLTADVYYQIKNYKRAEEFYFKARDLYETFFSKTHPEYVKILSKQARVYYMSKDYKQAKRNIEEALTNYEAFIKKYFPTLSEREKAKYWNTIKGDFEFYNTLAFSKIEDFRDVTSKVYNYQLLTKALLLSSSIKIKERILNSADETLKTTYTEWLAKKELLTNALSMSPQQLASNSIDPSVLSNEVEKLEKELSEKSELFGQSFENKKITYENVQKSLAPNDVAIEMVRYRHFDHKFTDSIVYVCLYVKNDNARPKAIKLPEGYRLESRFYKYYRNSIVNKTVDEYSYNAFWEPIQKGIGQYSTIYLSPDGVYNLVILESIPTPDGKYVIDNSNIVMVSNTKDLYLRKVKSKSVASINQATIFGNPKFYLTASSDEKIAALPGTEKEANELEELLKQKGWKTNQYVETSATEERAKEQESPKIFHIATHGFTPETEAKKEISELSETEAELANNPLLKTGLLLKGAGDLLNKTKYNYNIESGILTAYEAMSLNLDRTDLVVLSACETGLGEVSNGEGVYGLQRAFLVAGAKTLIMSMFKVDDEATQKLILNFYKKWLTTGNLRASFIEAKKELRVEYPEPIYWGSFMMIGLD